MTTRKTKKKTDPQAIEPTSAASVETPAELTPTSFPIVGVGASAGGLAAFEAFFSGMPADSDPGMAFVLVQHLAPEHKSILAELIQRCTRMQVFEVEDGMTVRINCVYIIPPNYDMALLNGSLQLLEPVAPRGQRLPIDFFFRSLAQDQREQAIGIVLSGTASDGTLGVRAIKGEGGIVMVQSPESTEFDGMPRSALATGLVDYELPPAEMPAYLIAYARHAFDQTRTPTTNWLPKTKSALEKIFILLRNETGHDFSQYKPSTIHRRIERRMVVHQIEDADVYVKYLQRTPTEVESLFRDLLIGVTHFFRDPDAFQVLADRVIPQLISDKAPGSVIRVWSTGCSTGEEAYSVAMLLQEGVEALKRTHTVQVFATDIDSRAVNSARAGIYPASIATDISPERLSRFFTLEPGGKAYRINKSLRDMLVFSEQDVIKDPPFSKLDLISCRNLLIYFRAELQRKIIPLFHYALNPHGILFLGASEGVGESEDLFSVLDRKAKIYQRKDDIRSPPRLAMERVLPSVRRVDATLPNGQGKTAFAGKLSLRELTERAICQQMPLAAALVNANGDILYLHGRSGMYLELAPGEASYNIVKMAREGLQQDLTIALHNAKFTHETVRAQGLNVKTNGHFTRVNLSISRVLSDPATGAEPRELMQPSLFLVLLEEAPALESALPPAVLPADSATAGADPESVAAAHIRALKEELRAKDEYIQCTHEELESSNEELKSSNEEMQSVNEELSTVNSELQIKVLDLMRVNNDMNNLLSSTGIATVFVDHDLRILRFTPSVMAIINLIATDIGRPVAHFVSNLVGYSSLLSDTQAVLDTLIPREVDVQSTSGRWYLLRIQPYRTNDNVIEGAVMTFIDITEMKQAKEASQKSLAILNETGAMAKVGGWELELATGRADWTDETFRIFEIGSSENAPPLREVLDCYSPESRPVIEQAVQRAAEQGESFSLELELVTRKGNRLWVHMTGKPNYEKDKIKNISGTIQDITERKGFEEALRQANDQNRLAVVVHDAYDAITVQDLAGRTLAWNPGAERLYGWSEAEALAMNVSERIPPDLRKGALFTLIQLGQAKVLEPYLTQRLSKDGSRVNVSIVSTVLRDAIGQMYAIATTERGSELEMGTPEQVLDD